MKIVYYSVIAMFITIPFQGAFRNPLLSLPGTFRDSVFLQYFTYFLNFSPGTVDFSIGKADFSFG